VLEYFPDSEAVNKAPRSLIAFIPNKRKMIARRMSNDVARHESEVREHVQTLFFGSGI
jgi:hypothetical protein